MDLTKLVERFAQLGKEAYFESKFERSATFDFCSVELRKAPAAVPQDTVEAVRVAALRSIGTHFTLTQLEQVDAAIRQALAARPVRAVLTEDEVRESFHSLNLRAEHVVGLTAALNAALDRQHAEPPSAQEALCGSASNADISMNAASRPTATDVWPSDTKAQLLPDQEWNALSNESKNKVQKWFDLAAERLQLILDEPHEDAAVEEAKPWLYAIAEPSGAWHDGENCVFGDEQSAQDEVDMLNDDLAEDEEHYMLVPLYRRLVCGAKP